MKLNKIQLTNLLLILLLGILLSSLSSLIKTTATEIPVSNTLRNPTLQALTNHGPINIEYDENFTDYGFPGTGTPGDPFRIENYNITVSSDYPILFGGNQSKHFVIQNCFLKTDTNYGIYLGKYFEMEDGIVNVLNNVIIAESNKGIVMYGGNNSLISGNTITSQDGGIYISDSIGFSTISYNVIFSIDDIGIYLDNSPNITITRNTCVGGWVGISLNNMDDSIVTYNNCSENEIGIELMNASNNHTVTNNILINNSDTGIIVADIDNSVFTNNLFKENTNYAIRVDFESDNNIVHHNAFIDNNLPGVQASDDGSNNIWYDTISLEGNFWSEWVSGSYSIDGTASAVDPYPLNSMPVIQEYSSSYIAILMILGFLAIPLIKFVNKKKRN